MNVTSCNALLNYRFTELRFIIKEVEGKYVFSLNRIGIVTLRFTAVVTEVLQTKAKCKHHALIVSSKCTD